MWLVDDLLLLATVAGVEPSGEGVSLLVFTAPWVPISDAVRKVVSQQARDDGVVVSFRNADEAFAECEAYHVVSLPCAVVVRDGNVTRKFVGADVLGAVPWLVASQARKAKRKKPKGR